MNHPNQENTAGSQADIGSPTLDEFIKNKDYIGSASSITRLPNISTTEIPVGVEVQREKTRTRLAGGLLGLLAFSLFGVGAYIIVDTVFPSNLSEEKRNSHRELMTIIWTSQVTLVSGALGFYFGSERNGSNG